MTKLVFKPVEIHRLGKEIKVDLPDSYKKAVEEEEDEELDDAGRPVDIYQGPSIEEMEEELENYRKEIESESEKILNEAKERALQIEENGRNIAFQQLAEAREKIKQELEGARQDAQREKDTAKFDAERMIKDAELQIIEIEHESREKGYKAGREAGFKDGQAEVTRLIDRLGTIVSHAVDVREEIIKSSEKQMVNIILTVCRKVIKDEIGERKDVVLNNIRAALQKIKGRDRVDIRVNFADLELTTSNKDELIKMLESLKKVNVYEDSRVDRGGVIITTDVGEIDARVSTQLDEIEEAIRNAEPL
jgi:flagellar assembly protein FliH